MLQSHKLTKERLHRGWVRLLTMGSFNLEGKYYEHVRVKCGSFDECESAAREINTELAAYDFFNSMCYLARNVFDLGGLAYCYKG